MGFNEHFTNALFSDINDVDVPIPEDIADRLKSWDDEYQTILTDLAIHFYGENPTAEQLVEMALLVAMWSRKELGCADSINGEVRIEAGL